MAWGGSQPRSKVDTLDQLARLPWIEAIVSGFLGIIFLVWVGLDLAEITWIVGALLSLTRYALVTKFEAELLPVRTMSQVLDLQRKLPSDEFQELVRKYLEITEPEFSSVKESVVSECLNRLDKLAREKTSEVLETGDYFNWLFPALEAANEGDEIWAISMMMDIEWEESQPEETFLELNLAAADRGVAVERIFVVRREQYGTLLSNKYIKGQYDHIGTHLHLLVAEREYLERRDPRLLEALGDGLIGVNDRVVLVDVSAPEGFRGYVTMNTAEILRRRRLYNNLRVNARPMQEVGRLDDEEAARDAQAPGGG